MSTRNHSPELGSGKGMLTYPGQVVGQTSTSISQCVPEGRVPPWCPQGCMRIAQSQEAERLEA